MRTAIVLLTILIENWFKSLDESHHCYVRISMAIVTIGAVPRFNINTIQCFDKMGVTNLALRVGLPSDIVGRTLTTLTIPTPVS